MPGAGAHLFALIGDSAEELATGVDADKSAVILCVPSPQAEVAAITSASPTPTRKRQKCSPLCRDRAARCHARVDHSDRTAGPSFRTQSVFAFPLLRGGSTLQRNAQERRSLLRSLVGNTPKTKVTDKMNRGFRPHSHRNAPNCPG